MLIIIDNYDSFTYNLVDYFKILDQEVNVIRNDTLSVKKLLSYKPKAFVISPGPGSPKNAGVCLELVARAAKEKIPILGICLGHQVIGQVFGAKIIRAKLPIHGKTSTVIHFNHSIFDNIPQSFNVVRYHSLIIDNSTISPDILVTSVTNKSIIMSISHKTLNIHGIQFHPESIGTEFGLKLLENFLKLAL